MSTTDSFACCAALDLLPMLVGAGQEVDLVPSHPPKAGDDVGRHVLVDVADVGEVVDVMDCGGDVETILLGHVRDCRSSGGGRIVPREVVPFRAVDGDSCAWCGNKKSRLAAALD